MREADARTKSFNKLKQIGLGLHHYHDSIGHFPSAHIELCPAGTTAGTESVCSYYSGWAIDLLPFIEQTALWRSYNFTVPNVSTTNQAFCQSQVKVYSCPSDTRAGLVLGPETLPPDGRGQPNPPSLYMTGSYKVMT